MLAALDLEIDIGKKLMGVKAFGQMLHSQHIIAT